MLKYLDFNGTEYTVICGIGERFYPGKKTKSARHGKIRSCNFHKNREDAEKELAAYASKKGWQLIR